MVLDCIGRDGLVSTLYSLERLGRGIQLLRLRIEQERFKCG